MKLTCAINLYLYTNYIWWCHFTMNLFPNMSTFKTSECKTSVHQDVQYYTITKQPEFCEHYHFQERNWALGMVESVWETADKSVESMVWAGIYWCDVSTE